MIEFLGTVSRGNFRKECHRVLPDLHLHIRAWVAQTYPYDKIRVAISYNPATGWLYSGNNGCHGHGPTLESAIRNSDAKYKEFIEGVNRQG